MPRVVVPLVSEAYRDPVLGECPEFFDEPVVQLLGPLATEESKDFVSSVDKLRSVPPSCVNRIFCIALSRVNGGKGGRADVVAVAMISSPGIDSFGISINSCTRAAISSSAVSKEKWPPSTM